MSDSVCRVIAFSQTIHLTLSIVEIVYFSRPVQHDGIEIEILADICNMNCEKLAIMRAKHFEILTKRTTFACE